MSDEIRKDNIKEGEEKRLPPRPPVLPRSYSGAPTIKPNVQKASSDINKQVHKVNTVQSIKANDNAEAEVIITKSNTAIPVKNTEASSTQYVDKKNLFKALAAVLAIVVIVGGVFAFVILKSQTSVSADIKILDKPNAGLANLNSISKYKNLEELRLYNSGIKNIDGIKNLKDLKIVYLRENNITDIGALKDLKNVEYLHLEGNNITDISALAGLTNLKVLYIGHNNISDLSPLANLVKLEELDLSFNQVTDVTSLKNLTNLRKLKLNNNQITNIDALKDLKELRDLFLRENGEIEDLTPLLGMHKMEWCSFNPKGLEIEIIYQLKEANPNAIYYFYYNGEHLYAFDEFVYDPGEIPVHEDED